MEKGDVMTFEQPAELNQYLDPPRKSGAPPPFWLEMKIYSPMIFFSCLMMMEVRWLRGLPFLEGLILSFLMLVVVPLIGRYDAWKADKSKRTLSIYDDCLGLSRIYQGRVRWKWIQRFRIEPCGPQGEFKKFTVCYGGDRNKRWSMIFTDPAACAALLSALEKQRTGKDRKWAIEMLKAPVITGRFTPVGPLWLCMVSLLLLLHGFASLVAVFTPSEKPPRVTPEGLGPPAKALVKWFVSSGVNPDEFFKVTGAALTAVGGGGVLISMTLLERRKKAWNAKEAEDVKEKIEAAGGTVEIK